GARASAATGKGGEGTATSAARLLRYPSPIEKLYMTKAVSMSTADRLIHLAVRNGIQLGFAAFKEAAVAIQNELIVEPTEEPTFDDELFRATAEVSTELAADLTKENVFGPGVDGKEVVKLKFVPIFATIPRVTVTQKIRYAILGSGT